jgi:uncharacterized lipoprotein YmbA
MMWKLMALSSFALTGCSGASELEYVQLRIPAQLLAPVSVPSDEVATVNQLAERLVETRAGLDQANGQIVAIAEIVCPTPENALPQTRVQGCQK